MTAPVVAQMADDGVGAVARLEALLDRLERAIDQAQEAQERRAAARQAKEEV